MDSKFIFLPFMSEAKNLIKFGFQIKRLKKLMQWRSIFFHLCPGKVVASKANTLGVCLEPLEQHV